MTYSIIARDRETGDLGVAVQSRAFNTAAGVAWARSGVGAIASQSVGERRYGYRGLELLAEGVAPEDALAGLVAEDERQAYRQVAIIDAGGRIAQHTGSGCIASAGHSSGDGWAAQANLVDGPAVWEAMGKTFESAAGTLARRLLAALDAAEAAGGDWRGRQAGGILVVPAEGDPWTRVIDLRVEDSDEPLPELRRLLDMAEAHRGVNRAESGRAALARAGGLRDVDIRWAEIMDAVGAGEIAHGRELLEPLLAEEPRWAAYVGLLADLLEPRARELLD